MRAIYETARRIITPERYYLDRLKALPNGLQWHEAMGEVYRETMQTIGKPQWICAGSKGFFIVGVITDHRFGDVFAEDMSPMFVESKSVGILADDRVLDVWNSDSVATPRRLLDLSLEQLDDPALFREHLLRANNQANFTIDWSMGPRHF